MKKFVVIRQEDERLAYLVNKMKKAAVKAASLRIVT
jgi:hypothetical protein